MREWCADVCCIQGVAVSCARSGGSFPAIPATRVVSGDALGTNDKGASVSLSFTANSHVRQCGGEIGIGIKVVGGDEH